MPTYEFTCPDGHDFDKFFRSMVSAPTVVPCPICGKPADRQMSAGAGLVFHGTGFYITDYGKDGKKDQNAHSRRTSESKHGATADPKPSDGSSASGASESAGSSASSGSAGGESSSAPAATSSSEGASSASTTPKKPAAPPKASE